MVSVGSQVSDEFVSCVLLTCRKPGIDKPTSDSVVGLYMASTAWRSELICGPCCSFIPS